MRKESVDDVAERMSGISVPAQGRVPGCFAWSSEPDRGRPAMSDALLSLADHPLHATLSDEQRWRLGLAEMVHFFSLNIAGERELLTGLTRLLKSRTSSPAVAAYIRHVLEEESAHMEVFETFCQRYAGKVYADRQMRLPRRYLPGEEEFLLFAQMLVFEEISGWFNRKLAVDRSLWPLVRDINEYHAAEEARHLVFGRAMVESLWEKCAPGWQPQERHRIGAYLNAYVKATLRRYVDPSVYVDAGIPGNAFKLREEALSSPGWRLIEYSATKRIRTVLDGLGTLQ